MTLVFACLEDYLVHLSVFEERSAIGGSDEMSNQIYHRIEDEFFIVIRSVPQMENEIEKLINLHRPCIAGSIGFVVSIESESPQELKILRLYSEGWHWLMFLLFIRYDLPRQLKRK
jgi:hypothetical protein